MNIAHLWDRVLNFEYDETKLTEGLDDFLRQHKDEKILDCACGTGFAVLNLEKQGYNITYSDGSQKMIKEFRKKRDDMGLKGVRPHRVMWSALGKRFKKKFDVVICRGSSLIYASGWDKPHQHNEGIIHDALRNFSEALKPGGMLYIDTTSEDSLYGKHVISTTYFPKRIQGQKTKLHEVLYTNRSKKIRTWKPVLRFDHKQYALTRYSAYLPHEDLTDMLKSADFRHIRRRAIPGEHYAVFTAYKS